MSNRHCFFACVCAALLAIVLCCDAFAQEAAKIGWDFEKQALSAEWSAGGKITAVRAIGEPAEKPKPARPDDLVPSGQVATIDAEPGSFFALKKDLPRVPWERAERISFWVSRTVEEAKRDPECTLDVMFIDAKSVAVLSRRVILKGSGWQQVELPTQWIAPTTGRIGSWANVQRLAFSFREESHLALDAIQAELNARPRPALTLTEMLPIAFPGVAPTAIKKFEADGLVVATNATDCNPAQVAAHLQPLIKQIAREVPLGEPIAPARLLVFATRDEYQKFPPRLALQYGKEALPPKSDGYTLLGWATAHWDPNKGAERPVFAHELVHSLFESRLGLANQGEWFQEGLATYYQLYAYPQKDFPEIVQDGIANNQYDLKAVTSGKPINITAYWQAATLCSLLLRDPAYQPKFKELIAAFQKAENTALEPHLATVLKVDYDRLTNDWRKHCREAWPVK